MAAKARVEVLRREMGEEVFAQYRKIRLDEAENTPEGEAFRDRWHVVPVRVSFCGELAGRDAILCGTG